MPTSTLFPTTISGDTASLQLTATVGWTTAVGGTPLGGIIRGRAGAGKTRLADTFVRSLHETGHNVLHIDPLGGRRLNTLSATWRAHDMKSATTWFKRLETELHLRVHGGEYRLQGVQVTGPVYVIVDHAEIALSEDANVLTARRIAELGDRYGFGLILVGRKFPGILASTFESSNSLVFSYPNRIDSVGYGIDIKQVTGAPVHLRSPQGKVVGFDLVTA